MRGAFEAVEDDERSCDPCIKVREPTTMITLDATLAPIDPFDVDEIRYPLIQPTLDGNTITWPLSR